MDNQLATWQGMASRPVTASTTIGARVARWQGGVDGYMIRGTVTNVTNTYVTVAYDGGGTTTGPISHRAHRIIAGDTGVERDSQVALDTSNAHAADVACLSLPVSTVWEV